MAFFSYYPHFIYTNPSYINQMILTNQTARFFDQSYLQKKSIGDINLLHVDSVQRKDKSETNF